MTAWHHPACALNASLPAYMLPVMQLTGIGGSASFPLMAFAVFGASSFRSATAGFPPLGPSPWLHLARCPSNVPCTK
jgi:hypothetical protein